MVRSKIDYAIRSRINRTDKIKGAFNQQSKSEIYNQAENSKNKSGYYWCGDAYDPKKQRVLRNYEQISKLNVDKPSGKSSKGQNDYYEKCVNNVESTLNQQEYKEKDPETQRTLKSKYNEDLSKQIESKKNLQNKMYSSWKEKERIEAEKMEARYQKQREENNQRRIRRNKEFNTANQELISARQNREKFDRDWDAKYAAGISSKVQKEMADIKQQQEERIKSARSKINAGLSAQLAEKEQRLKQQRLNDLKLNDLNSIGVGRRKKETSNCDCCHKTYEKYEMTPETNYKSIIEASKRNKESSK